MHFIGLISGTSMDAVDAALVRFEEDACELAAYLQYPYSAELGLALKAVDSATPVSQLAVLDARVGDAFAEAALALLRGAGVGREAVRAVGSHGQTVYHAPAPGARNSIQIGDPNRIARRTGIATVADFRRMDMAAGGEGAPLAPAYHAWRFRNPEVHRAVLNLGGIANLTFLPAGDEPVTGFDTGPGNTLMDAWVRRHREQDMDRKGEWGASGRVVRDLLERMLADPWFRKAPPKSTGKEYFHPGWIEKQLAGADPVPRAEDVQATLAELTSRSIATALEAADPRPRELLVCGGGVHNENLMARLRNALPAVDVKSTAALGVDPDAVEAMVFAWLARQRVEGKPGNLPSVTGAREAVVLGAIYEAAISNKR